MTILDSRQVEQQAARWAAYLMAVSARTAPKASGVDNISTMVLENEDEIEALAQAMETKCEKKKIRIDSFLRDANNVRQCAAVLLIGVAGTMPKTPQRPLNCGGCGYADCGEYIRSRKRQGEDFVGPICLFQALDLGIALGSAVKMASDLNMDNRMMYTIGAAAKEVGLLDADVVIGIPLSVSGKSIFFDRDASPRSPKK